MTAKQQLAKMQAVCRSLGAEVSVCPEQRHFTAMLWEDRGVAERDALSVQEKILKQTAQYPKLVCYCFDPFSTLVYAI